MIRIMSMQLCTSPLKTVCGAMLCVPILLSCASVPSYTKEQCQSGAWRALAIQDGLAGLPDDQIADRIKECKSYNIELDTKVYTEGYVDGLLHRCTERYGKLIGYTSNMPKPEACPDYRREEFMKGYDEGVAEGVADQLDPLLSKPEARRKREARIAEMTKK